MPYDNLLTIPDIVLTPEFFHLAMNDVKDLKTSRFTPHDKGLPRAHVVDSLEKMMDILIDRPDHLQPVTAHGMLHTLRDRALFTVMVWPYAVAHVYGIPPDIDDLRANDLTLPPPHNLLSDQALPVHQYRAMLLTSILTCNLAYFRQVIPTTLDERGVITIGRQYL